MNLHAVLEQAQFETEVRDRWTAVFDRRSEFRTTFGTSRVGKIENGRLFITPAALSSTAELLIRGAGRTVEYLRSGDPLRSHAYPGFSINELAEDDLAKFLAYLRHSIDSHINAGVQE